MIKAIVYIFSLFFMTGAWACKIKNLTDQSQQKVREDLFNKTQGDPGVRIAWNNIKPLNTSYGIGTVNSAISEYEEKLCNRIERLGIKNVEIKKTDFKGYYVTCSSGKDCSLAELSKQIKKVSVPFPNTVVLADSYQEGYVKARFSAQYKNYKGPLDTFINEEIQKGLQIARAKYGDELKSKEFIEKLEKEIEVFRKSGEKSVDANLRSLVKGLDALEVPFVNSHDIDEELKDALDGKNSIGAGSRRISTAITGDDLFLVIKKGDQVEKVIGADARGLGVLNIKERHLKLLEYLEKDPKLKTKDILNLSLDAIKSADEQVDKSLNTYTRLIQESLDKGDLDLEESIARGHDNYVKKAQGDSRFLSVRAGAIDDCGKGKGCIADNITLIHNRLKSLEKAGKDGHFGRSCLATEFLLYKYNIK